MNNIKKNISMKFSIGFLAVLMLSFGSCKRSDDPVGGNGEAKLNVQIDGVSFEEDNIDFDKKSSTNGSVASGIVKDTSLVYDDFVVDVKMTQDNDRSNRTVSNHTVYRGSDANMAAAVTKTTELTKGTKYRLVAFNADGSFNQAKDYTYGNEGATSGMSLDAGKKYTFVAYSINSANDPLPDLVYTNSVTNFANAKLVDVSKDLMVFVLKGKQLTYGDNKLGVILKHRFSMITTRLTMDSKMTGSIKTLANTTIGKVDASATFNFNGETITYKNNQSTFAAINFPTLGTGLRDVTSYPTLLINPAATNKTLNFGTITIDDETKTNFSIANIRVNPGCKYNLNLNFRTCTQEVKLADDALNWRYPETGDRKGCYDPKTGEIWKNGTLLTKTLSAPASNYGFTFDITELDNAVNMEVNGVKILTDPKEGQIQFQTYDNTANGEGIITRNIKFADGTEYGTGNIGNIWTLKGSAATPLIRIIISKTGEVTMLGSKTSNGPLVQLVLKGSLKFNNVPWKTSGVNTIKVTQKVSNTTFVVGRGYGQAKIACK